jgi:uncharacterized protein (DUF433 family)
VNTSTPDRDHVAVLHSLRHARGRYSTDRAAQLSGIPRSTLYDWHRNDVYVPDFAGAHSLAWSYRDLVFVRVLAWLRNDVKTPRPVAAKRVVALKKYVASGKIFTVLNADRNTLVLDGDGSEPLDGSSRLFADMLCPLDLVAAVGDFGSRERLWGPHLVTPSDHTFISPWVLGGDPCVTRTRIPTASLYSLRTDRGLDLAEVVALYPGLDPVAAEDAYRLEARLRGAGDLEAA